MTKNDIFVNFPFFRYPNQWKKRKNGIHLGAFFAFFVFVFNQKRKNKKMKSIPLNFLFFHF